MTPLEHLISCDHVDVLYRDIHQPCECCTDALPTTMQPSFYSCAGVRYWHGTYSLGWSNQFWISVFSSNHFFLTNWRHHHHWKIPTTWLCTMHTPWTPSAKWHRTSSDQQVKRPGVSHQRLQMRYTLHDSVGLSHCRWFLLKSNPLDRP